jgi:hypothetical protein
MNHGSTGIVERVDLPQTSGCRGVDPACRCAGPWGSKEAIGTAHSTASPGWYTDAAGILTKVFYPTIETPQSAICSL